MAKTATQQALDLITRWAKVAERDGTPAGGHGIKVTPKGRYTNLDGTRIGHDQAVQIVAAALNTEALPPVKAPKAPKTPTGPMTWDKLNQNTKDFFFRICEEIQTATQDHDMTCPVRLGRDIPHIGLVDAPRLSNLKKVGVIRSYEGEKKTHKMLVLTELGQAIWAAHA